MGTYEILRVELTSGVSRRETVPDSLIDAYIGGKGLAAHYLPGTCRHVVVTKSPATGGFLDTCAGEADE